MIKGFEEYTEKLSEHELQMVPALAAILSRRTGAKQAINNQRLCSIIYNEYTTYYTREMIEAKFKITAPRIRKMIHHIRCNNIVPRLCSNSSGYYIGNKEETIDYITSLNGRIEAITRIKNAIESQMNLSQLTLNL
jgi:hypothetical protein